MDSYTKILKLMEKHGSVNNPTTISLATVISPPPNLIIQTGNLQVTSNNILIADYLLNTYNRQVTIAGTTEQISFIDTLNVGDTLAVQEIQDGQTYIILCRVVTLNG